MTGPDPTLPAPPPPDPPPPSRARRFLKWTLIGCAVLLTIVGVCTLIVLNADFR